MIALLAACSLIFFAGILVGVALTHSRYVQGLKDAVDYAEVHALASAQAARRAIDTHRATLTRVHALYVSRRKVTATHRRYVDRTGAVRVLP